MISRAELERVADAKGLSLKNCERDYLLDLLLFNLYRTIKDELVFIPFNISKRERVHTATSQLVISAFSEIPSYNVYSLSMKEIAAENVRAILTRHKPRDLYDLWFLLKRREKPDKGMIDAKLRASHMLFSPDALLERVNQLQPAWKTDLQHWCVSDHHGAMQQRRSCNMHSRRACAK